MQYAARTEQRVLLRVNALCVGGVGAADRLQYLRVGDRPSHGCGPDRLGTYGVQPRIFRTVGSARGIGAAVA